MLHTLVKQKSMMYFRKHLRMTASEVWNGVHFVSPVKVRKYVGLFYWTESYLWWTLSEMQKEKLNFSQGILNLKLQNQFTNKKSFLWKCSQVFYL